MRANVFYSSGKDLNGSAVILVYHEARRAMVEAIMVERP